MPKNRNQFLVNILALAALSAFRPRIHKLGWIGVSLTKADLRNPKHLSGRNALYRRAKGFGEEVSAQSANTPQPDPQEMFKVMSQIQEQVAAPKSAPKEKIIIPDPLLPAPLKAPAAPASYEALTKLRLRVAPSKFADLITSKVIEKGEIFRVVDARDDDEIGLTYLQVEGAYDDGWIMDKGIAGPFARKKLVKRVAGSLAASVRPSVHELSEVESAEVVNGDQPDADAQAQTGAWSDTSGYPKEILDLLADPKIMKMCADMGVDGDTLKNAVFLRAVSRRLYGEEVVS